MRDERLHAQRPRSRTHATTGAVNMKNHFNDRPPGRRSRVMETLERLDEHSAAIFVGSPPSREQATASLTCLLWESCGEFCNRLLLNQNRRDDNNKPLLQSSSEIDGSPTVFITR
jgi:hypothetical protein